MAWALLSATAAQVLLTAAQPQYSRPGAPCTADGACVDENGTAWDLSALADSHTIGGPRIPSIPSNNPVYRFSLFDNVNVPSICQVYFVSQVSAVRFDMAINLCQQLGPNLTAVGVALSSAVAPAFPDWCADHAGCPGGQFCGVDSSGGRCSPGCDTCCENCSAVTPTRCDSFDQNCCSDSFLQTCWRDPHDCHAKPPGPPPPAPESYTLRVLPDTANGDGLQLQYTTRTTYGVVGLWVNLRCDKDAGAGKPDDATGPQALPGTFAVEWRTAYACATAPPPSPPPGPGNRTCDLAHYEECAGPLQQHGKECSGAGGGAPAEVHANQPSY